MNKNILFFIVSILFTTFNISLYTKEAFLLIMGPSGVGKSTIIKHLKELDSRFTYISPFTTRPLRDGEIDKIHVSLEKIKLLEQEGKLLTTNQFYGIYYATPKYIIDEILSNNLFAILDWPIEKIDIMNHHYADALFKVYIAPENTNELKRRLTLDNRDTNGSRLSAGLKEIDSFINGEYDQEIDLKIINSQGSAKETAHIIYEHFIHFLKQ